MIAPELPFAINCLELTEAEQTVAFDGFRIEAYKVNHNVLCYGYNIIVERIGRFDVSRALQLNIPKNYWNRLQKGEMIMGKADNINGFRAPSFFFEGDLGAFAAVDQYACPVVPRHHRREPPVRQRHHAARA